jgi:hypothetical protein
MNIVTNAKEQIQNRKVDKEVGYAHIVLEVDALVEFFASTYEKANGLR